jgi:hypothetical protein
MQQQQQQEVAALGLLAWMLKMGRGLLLLGR